MICLLFLPSTMPIPAAADAVRLEGELQSARSDYEEAAKESRRKTARLQKCVLPPK